MFNRHRILGLAVGATSCLLGSSGAWAGQARIDFGPADSEAWDQPRVAFEIRDPATGEVLGPWWDFSGALLDTGANSIMLFQMAYLDEDFDFRTDMYPQARRTDGSVVQFMELGVAGTSFYDVLQPLNWVYMGDDGNERVLSGVVGMGAPDAALGPTALIGMPAMQGKRVLLNTRSIGEQDFMSTSFVDAPVSPSPTTYRVRLKMLPAEHMGQIEPEDPLPVYADLPMIPGIETGQGQNTSSDTFLLDTGAGLSMITTATAARLGLNMDPDDPNTDILDYIPIGGIGGSIDAPMVIIDRISIPTVEGVDLVMTDLVVAVLDIPGIGGIFGMNMLTSGQVPPILSEDGIGVTGYFDSALLDFTGTRGWMNLTVNSDFHLPTSNGTALLWQGGADGRWEAGTSSNWLDGTSSAPFQQGNYVLFDDRGVGNVQIAAPVSPGSITINNPTTHYVFTGAPITGSTGLTKLGAGTATFYNRNTYKGVTHVDEGTLVFAAEQDIGPVYVWAGASMHLQASAKVEALNIEAGSVRLSRAAGTGQTTVLEVGDLDITLGGTLDLQDNAAIIRSSFQTPQELLDRVTRLIASGRGTDGLWQGTGLLSSMAADDPLMGLAVLLNDRGTGVPYYTTFEGQPVDSEAVLLLYTYNGDTDLNRVIDASDYFRIHRGLAKGLSGYANGDFDYDGDVDPEDLALLDRSFLGQSRPLAAGQALATVPEPGLLGLGALGLLTLGRRVRRPAPNARG